MKRLSVLLALCVLSGEIFANGVATVVTGTVQVQTGTSPPRSVRQGDEVNQGDTLATGANSTAVVKFDDGEVLALVANSRMTITSYRYDPRLEVGEILFSLVTGGMRAVTGLIGRRAPQKVFYRAGATTVGIRGTDVSIAVAGANVALIVTEGQASLMWHGNTISVPAGSGSIVTPEAGIQPDAIPRLIASARPELRALLDALTTMDAALVSAGPGTPRQGSGEVVTGAAPSGGFPWIPGWTSATPPRDRTPNAFTVRVFYATDRDEQRGRNIGYGTSRSYLRYGTCDVSIPRAHRPGELESPSLWRLEFSPDIDKHVVLIATTPETTRRFYRELGERVKGSAEKSAFLFIHGYNVTFEDAARRTAQIYFDLRFEGAPVFYSWPSQGNLAEYTVDESNIEWSQRNIKNFLAEFFDQSAAENVYVIAHSMGNRALTWSLAAVLAENKNFRARVKEVILTAPDIDADIFKRDIAPALVTSGRPITLYASADDVALAASKKVHGYARAGDAGGGILITTGIETIDATGVDTSFLGHSYFAETRTAIADIAQLIKGRRAGDRSTLSPVESASGRYWTFKK